MLKRCITGACLIALTIGFFFLRKIDERFFALYVFLLSAVSSFEVNRALKNLSTKKCEGRLGAGNVAMFIIIALCVLGYAPVFVFWDKIKAVALLLGGLISVLILKAFYHTDFKKETPYAILSLLYPSAFLISILFINSYGEKSLTALVAVFVIGPVADTFAYFVGSLIKGKKLCPKISPNKTISGFIGGLVGGLIAGIVIYAVFKPAVSVSLPYFIFAIIGLFGALFTAMGDLFESVIKRKCGVKDMGKLLPGHGGVTDRIDGISFIAVFIAIVFCVI